MGHIASQYALKMLDSVRVAERVEKRDREKERKKRVGAFRRKDGGSHVMERALISTDVSELQNLILRWDTIRDSVGVLEEISEVAENIRRNQKYRKGELIVIRVNDLVEPLRL